MIVEARRTLLTLEAYLEFPYDITKGPDERVMGHDPRLGLNCQFLGHEATNLIHWIDLPPSLKSAEIFAPNDYFVEIDDPVNMRRGDIALFVRLSRLPDPQLLHWAISTGRINKERSPTFIHASHEVGKVVEWSLDQFTKSRYHYELVGIRGIIPSLTSGKF